jgi:hypothetical protein
MTSREDFMAGLSDVDPMKHAGENWGATDEYFPQDIDNPYVRGDVTDPEGYYPGPDMKRRKWPPYRGNE